MRYATRKAYEKASRSETCRLLEVILRWPYDGLDLFSEECVEVDMVVVEQSAWAGDRPTQASLYHVHCGSCLRCGYHPRSGVAIEER